MGGRALRYGGAARKDGRSRRRAAPHRARTAIEMVRAMSIRRETRPTTQTAAQDRTAEDGLATSGDREFEKVSAWTAPELDAELRELAL